MHPATAHTTPGSAPSASLDVLNVRAETAYPEVVAGARVRVTEMATHLRPLGVSVDFAPSLTSAEYRTMASPGMSLAKVAAVTRGVIRTARRPQADRGLILVHRLRSLVPGPGEKAPLDVYDFDDALYIGSEAGHHMQLRGLKREAARCVSNLRRARLVMAGNAVLADFARQHCERVEVVPSCVDPALQPQREHREVEALTLGWIGSSTTSGYMQPLIAVLDSVRSHGVPLRLILMGAQPGFQAPWIERRAWSVQAERDLLTEIDVGLMPLPDNPWTRGKCGYKLLRYFSAGLPTIASPVGVNTQLLSGAGGLSATSEAEWATAIRELAAGADVRRERGGIARGYAEREYSYSVWAPRVAELLSELER
jgi:glycosyltransferase involved in cell wall biosynthesis